MIILYCSKPLSGYNELAQSSHPMHVIDRCILSGSEMHVRYTHEMYYILLCIPYVMYDAEYLQVTSFCSWLISYICIYSVNTTTVESALFVG